MKEKSANETLFLGNRMRFSDVEMPRGSLGETKRADLSGAELGGPWESLTALPIANTGEQGSDLKFAGVALNLNKTTYANYTRLYQNLTTWNETFTAALDDYES